MIQSQLHPLRLKADPSRVVVRPFHLAWQGNRSHPARAQRLVDAVLSLGDREVGRQLQSVMQDFERRHWQTRKVFLRRFDQICDMLDLSLEGIGDKRKQLIGAYFCHEYSYAAAALMNPSIVPHPDQSGLDRQTIRVLMSLRAVGEGHISSIAFREGLVSSNGGFQLQPEPPFATAADAPDLDGIHGDGPVRVFRQEDTNPSGMVIFPVTPAQANGLEDLRLTQFTHDDGGQEYFGTYTAYSGRDIRSELLRTTNFREIDLIPMTGNAARNKGMALFPRMIDGRYMMVGRQDGQNLFLPDIRQHHPLGRRPAADDAEIRLGVRPDRQLRIADIDRRGLAAADPWRRRNAPIFDRRGAARSRRSFEDSRPDAQSRSSRRRTTTATVMCPTSFIPVAACGSATSCSCPMAFRTARSASLSFP